MSGSSTPFRNFRCSTSAAEAAKCSLKRSFEKIFKNNKRLYAIFIIYFISLCVFEMGCSGPAGTSSISTPADHPPAIGSTALLWDAPTTNADGTLLTDLAGYKVYYGSASGSYTQVIDLGLTTSFNLTNLAPGQYYFAVTAYDSSGSESIFSNELMKTL